MLLDEGMEFEHQCGSLFDGGVLGPGLLGLVGGLDGLVDVRRRRKTDFADDLGIGWIQDIEILTGGGWDEGPVDVVVDCDGGSVHGSG